MKTAVWLISLVYLPCASRAADGPLEPVTVCEVMKDPKLYDGRVIALLGRYSYRAEGRWIGEDGCKAPGTDPGGQATDIIRLSYSPDSAPRMASGYSVDGATVAEKIKTVRKSTTLRKFRFGSSDYDRWAVVYGRIKIDEKHVSGDKVGDKKESETQTPNGAAGELLYAGDGYVMFLRDPATQ